MKNYKFNVNSFDMLRLLAALQVAFLHSYEFSGNYNGDNYFLSFLELFPGVPIFFFVSGYLISKSYERSATLFSFSLNRILRLYPALIVCVVINLIMIAVTGYFQNTSVSASEIVMLGVAKSSFLQFYNPDFMRAFGDGVLNGSLWTICVEIQFYMLVPLLYKCLMRGGRFENIKLVMVIIVFIVANRCLFSFSGEYSQNIIWKLYRISFMPWLYMFLVGVLVQKNFEVIARYILKLNLLFLLIVYVCIAYLLSNQGMLLGNSISPLLFFPLVVLIFKFSYSNVQITNRLLRGNDISYGVYIWHMPIINQALYLYGYDLSEGVVVGLLGLTIFAGLGSWLLIEAPSLRLKKNSIKR
ncbi:acyltransferase family protein [Dasania marina]|uniref:acyltransferase family protein n=1 Tax=Dasania marina TaxID=471499 RepID=UPI00037E7DA2|nr:acyltransferase [Dasania marina]